MVPESKKRIGILGAGPAGCCTAYFLRDFCNVTLFDYSQPLRTILPTGGGRCNLAYAEFNFKELASYYPRGEKFLYSIFSRFSTHDTIELFRQIGIQTYTQSNNRIFPNTNSSEDVRKAFLNAIRSVKINKEKGLRIEPINNKIKIITDMNSYIFDSLVVTIGGHSNYDLISRLGINIISPCPSLVGLKTKEDLSKLAGITIPSVQCENIVEDLLFTHQGISGPLIYTISSLKARDEFPYNLNIDLLPYEFNLQNHLNNNPHKQIVTLLGDFVPRKLAIYILDKLKIMPETKCHSINGCQRDKIISYFHNFSLNIIGTRKDGEVVTAGGIDLSEVNPKTLESKKIQGLYFAGEVLDIDGLCGGFNLQNCWSTAYVVSEAIINS